jgi:hypothetical protein
MGRFAGDAAIAAKRKGCLGNELTTRQRNVFGLPVNMEEKIHADIDNSVVMADKKIEKLRSTSGTHVGLEILHLFIVDLLGRDTATAKIFRSKTDNDFKHAVIYTPFAK